MIELRCKNGRLLGEVDPEALALRLPCKTCTSVWGRQVYHHWPLGKILEAIGQGRPDGIVLPDNCPLPVDAEPV